MKNEHIVYAYAPLFGGSNLLLIGITDIGWEYLCKESGNYLHANPPNAEFYDVKEVWVVRGKDKNEIVNMIKKAAELRGVKLDWAN